MLLVLLVTIMLLLLLLLLQVQPRAFQHRLGVHRIQPQRWVHARQVF
jgi:hypothetical protein